LIRHVGGKVIVIWDNGTMHKDEPIRAVLRAFPRLTPYPADLNPVERLWG
jgi:transposase